MAGSHLSGTPLPHLQVGSSNGKGKIRGGTTRRYAGNRGHVVAAGGGDRKHELVVGVLPPGAHRAVVVHPLVRLGVGLPGDALADKRRGEDLHYEMHRG